MDGGAGARSGEWEGGEQWLGVRALRQCVVAGRGLKEKASEGGRARIGVGAGARVGSRERESERESGQEQGEG